MGDTINIFNTFSPKIIAEMMLDSREQEIVTDGIAAAISRYFFDYSDADEIDGHFWRALETIAEYASEPLEDIAQRAQDEVTFSTGRKIKPVLDEDDG